MDDKSDSIELLLSDLPQYTAKDYEEYIPYDRASHVCKTKDELQECLDKIYEAAKKVNADENYTMLFDHVCMEEFLIKIGELKPLYDPPEEILEIAQLEQELEIAKKNQQIIIIQAPMPIDQQSDIVPFSTTYDSVDDWLSSQSFVLGGKTINLSFGEYIVKMGTGAIAFYSEHNDTEIEICSHFVAPSAYIKSNYTGETVNLVYYRDSEWHELKNVKKSTLYESGSVAKYLIDHGIDANQELGATLANYFRTMEQLNRNTNIPVKKAITSLGWNSTFTAFAPYGEQYEFGAGNNHKRLYSGIRAQHGSFEKWKDAMKMIRDDEHIVARIILAASFASILIRPFDGMRFAVNIIGKSGIGKSVALRMAAGVWGNPNTVIASFGSTVYGALLRSNFLSDLPLILDESETKNKKEFDDFIYTMCGDYDRIKANSDEDPPTSKNCIFVSGEHPLLNESSRLGARNRVLDLKCDSFIFFDENRMNQYVTLQDANYGHAGNEFVNHLLTEGALQRAKEIYQQNLNSFPSDRQARIPAVILTADELIDEWLLHDGVLLTAEQLVPYLRSKTKEETSTVDYARIHESIEQWILKEIEDSKEKETSNGKVLPKRGSRKAAYAFKDNVLEQIIVELGGDTYAYVKWAETNRKLAAGKDAGHKYKRQVTFDDGTLWCFAVFIPERD